MLEIFDRTLELMNVNVMSTTHTDLKFRHKVTVGLLAALLGVFGAHWWYLRRPYAWLVTTYSVVLLVISAFADVWWENPAFFLLYIPILNGFIEAIVWCLMSDARFDARFNPGFKRERPSGWGAILVASFTLLIGTVAFMFGIAMIVIYVWSALGWLDGLNLQG
jgi:hypothetical protein